MKKHYILLLILAGIIGCTSEKKESESPIKFTANLVHIDLDSTVTSIAYQKGFILAAQENGTLLILDSHYQRRPDIEVGFEKLKIDYLISWRDTVFFSAQNKNYYLDSDLSPKDYKQARHPFHNTLYEDETWSISECCMGEFGGAVFFVERLTNKIWSYPATCASQVIRFKNGYWVCENLAHLSRYTGYTLIPDPKVTYALTADSLKHLCNWWVTVDSLREFWKLSNQNGIKRIEGPESSMTALNFVYHDSLYIVVSNDSATYLNVLRKDSLVIRDTLFRHPLNFHSVQTFPTPTGSVSLLSLTSGSPFAAYTFRGNSSAILVRNGHVIELLVKKSDKER